MQMQIQLIILDYKKLPRFKDFLDGFCINEYEIDKDYWIEGF